MGHSIHVGRTRLDRRHALEHGAAVLLLLREGVVSDWDTLYRSLGLETNFVGTGMALVQETVRALEQAGLVIVEGPRGSRYGRIRIVDRWNDIQRAMGISLADLANYDRHRSLVVNPWFGEVQSAPAPLDIFVLMPFRSELGPVYDDHISAVARDLKLTVVRADDLSGAGAVVSQMWNAINGARVILADCTGRNPNVFYEMGIAHTIGKSVILIAQAPDDVPFDIQHLRYVQYEFTPRGMREFESKLRQALITELDLDQTGAPQTTAADESTPHYCLFCGYEERGNTDICRACKRNLPVAAADATMIGCDRCMQFSLAIATYCEWCGQRIHGEE